MKYTPDEVAKLLANRPNQPHYVKALIEKCVKAAVLAERELSRDWPYLGAQRSRQWALRHCGQQDAPKPPACTRPEWDKRYYERHKITIARRRSSLPPSPFQGLMR